MRKTKIKEVNVEDIINGKVRRNEVVAYVYAKKHNIELFKDRHGIFYLVDNRRVYVPYREMLEELKGTYLRVGEESWSQL